MSSKMDRGLMSIGFLVVIFVAAIKQTHAQAFLLAYSDERVSTNIGQSSLETANSTNITEVYSITSATHAPTEFPKNTMDVITIIWYIATFLALMAFFLLMACSNKRRGNANNTTLNIEEQQQPPPTPAPSYSEFAPPSYDTVVTKNYPSVFVVSVPYLDSEKDKHSPPPFTYHTVSELQKSS